jgi:hypothetical protein
MATYVVFHNEMQEPDVLSPEDGTLKDVTEISDKIVYLENPNEDNRIVLWWEYGRHRVPVTAIGLAPYFDIDSVGGEPVPGITNVKILDDKCGMEFTIPAGTARPDGSWILNAQTEHTYFNRTLGREYTHRRALQGIIVSTKEESKAYTDRVYAKSN